MYLQLAVIWWLFCVALMILLSVLGWIFSQEGDLMKDFFIGISICIIVFLTILLLAPPTIYYFTMYQAYWLK